MSKKYKRGKIALNNYKQVEYSHILASPGDSPALIADPWSYIRSFIMQNHGKRGDAKKRSERALLYVRLAEDFYKAAETVDIPTKGTLFYYGMLNLVKCYLSMQGERFEGVIEHHGLTASPPLEDQIKVMNISSENAVNIFAKFSEKMGVNIDGEKTLKTKEIFRNIPELHNSYCGIYQKEKPKFLPLQIDYCVTEENNKLFTELRYKKENQKLYPTQKLYKGERKKYFIELTNENFSDELPVDWVIYRSKNKKNLTVGKGGNWNALYGNVFKEYQKFNICSILTGRGYYYYCDLEPEGYHHLCYVYMCMFYIGTAARYKPLELEKILGSKMRPLITEAMAICPRQFLYQITSLLTKKACVVPYAVL